MQDLVAGQIDFGNQDQLPQMRAGSAKAFAVTSDARLAAAPDVPTFAERGLPAVSYSAWDGLFAPKGTPRDIIGRLNAAVKDESDVTGQQRTKTVSNDLETAVPGLVATATTR
jgi:tripartite-type tricarboxylate transporter receptor subunit TctC